MKGSKYTVLSFITVGSMEGKHDAVALFCFRCMEQRERGKLIVVTKLPSLKKNQS